MIPLEVKQRIQGADARIVLLEGLLLKWVGYCAQAGAQPVSGDVRDNPVLQLIKDSRDALPSTVRPNDV